MSDSNRPEPFTVLMGGSCSAASAVIGRQYKDEVTGEVLFRRLAETEITHTEKRARNGRPIRGAIGTIVERPERFELTEDGAELIALANLFAAAPVLLFDLKSAAMMLRKYEAHFRLGLVAYPGEDKHATADANARMAARFEATIALAESIRC